MEDPKTYDIASLGDFLAVPESRLEECLRDFRAALESMRGKIPPGAVPSNIKFRWEDPAKRVMTFGDPVPIPRCMRSLLP